MSEAVKETAEEVIENAPEGSVAEGKKGKKKKRPKKQKVAGKQDKKLIIATVCAIAAFAVFLVCTIIQDRIVNGAVKASVVVAIKEVPAGTELNEQNMADYFEIQQRAIDQIPNTVQTYPTARNMIGKVTDRVIRTKEIVTADCFVSMDLYAGLEEPVEIALDLGAIGQTVGGVLRAGDYVDIKAVIKVDDDENADGLVSDEEFPEGLLDIEAVETVEETADGETLDDVGEDIDVEAVLDVADKEKEDSAIVSEVSEVTYGITGEYMSQLLAEDVRVTRVFNSGGENPETAAANGTTMVATVVNIAVPKNKVDAILIAQQEGVVSLIRVEKPDDAVINETVEEAPSVSGGNVQ